MNNEVILFKKEDFIFTKINEYNYKIKFNMINNKIQLDKIIDFGLMKLIYDLNPDIYLESTIKKINEDEVEVALLLKHFFEDLGLPQKYFYINMKKFVNDNSVIFYSKSITNKRPEWIPENAELFSIDTLICTCNIETPHKIHTTFDLQIEPNKNIPILAIQKLFRIIIHKIFKRVKQFIENL